MAFGIPTKSQTNVQKHRLQVEHTTPAATLILAPTPNFVYNFNKRPWFVPIDVAGQICQHHENHGVLLKL